MYQDKKKPLLRRGFEGRFSPLFRVTKNSPLKPQKCTFFKKNSKSIRKVAKNVAKMSPKTRTPQTLVALRFKALFFLIWHSALKRGVVVPPQILDFSAEKSPSSFSHVPIFFDTCFPTRYNPLTLFHGLLDDKKPGTVVLALSVGRTKF